MEPTYLTEEEMRLISAAKQHHTLKKAALALGMKYSTMRVRFYQLRQKRVKAQNTVNFLNNQVKGDPRLNVLLTPLKRELNIGSEET